MSNKSSRILRGEEKVTEELRGEINVLREGVSEKKRNQNFESIKF